MNSILLRYRLVVIISLTIFTSISCRKDEVTGLKYCEDQITTESIKRFKTSAYAFAYEELSLNSDYSEVKIDTSAYLSYLGRLSAIYNQVQPSDTNYYKLLHEVDLYKFPEISDKSLI